MIQYRLATGRPKPMYDGVYLLWGAPSCWEQDLLAVCLAGAMIMASHRSAARLHGISGFEREPSIEVTIPRGRWSRYPGVISHESLLIAKNDLAVVNGIPATAVDRTLIDLAAVVAIDRLEEAVHDALRRRVLTLPRLRWKLKQMAKLGRPGIAAVRTILEGWAPGNSPTESPLEMQFLRTIRKFGLPKPVRQYPIVHGGKRVARIDFAYPEVRLGIEVDGFRFHSNRKSWESDTTRGNFLATIGWRIIRVTRGDLKSRPAELCEQIAIALGIR